MGETCQTGSPAQGVLFAPPAPPAAPDLSGYDVILVNISGGKDSQATLDVTARGPRGGRGPEADGNRVRRSGRCR